MSEPKHCLTVSEMFDQAVLDCRNRGFTMNDAIKQVAEFFETSVGRVKRYICYGEDCSPEERHRVHQRYLDHLEAQQADFARRLEIVRRRLEEVRAQ